MQYAKILLSHFAFLRGISFAPYICGVFSDSKLSTEFTLNRVLYLIVDYLLTMVSIVSMTLRTIILHAGKFTESLRTKQYFWRGAPPTTRLSVRAHVEVKIGSLLLQTSPF